MDHNYLSNDAVEEIRANILRVQGFATWEEFEVELTARAEKHAATWAARPKYLKVWHFLKFRTLSRFHRTLSALGWDFDK